MLRIPLNSSSRHDPSHSPRRDAYTKTDKPHSSSNTSKLLLIVPLAFILLSLILVFCFLHTWRTPEENEPSWMLNSQLQQKGMGGTSMIAREVIPVMQQVGGPQQQQDDAIDSLDTTISHHPWSYYFSRWLQTRHALSSLTLDLRTTFPNAFPSSTTQQSQSQQQHRLTNGRIFRWPFAETAPKEGFSAGLPDFKGVFTRDSVVAMKMMFPVADEEEDGKEGGYTLSSFQLSHPSITSSTLSDLLRFRSTLLLLSSSTTSVGQASKKGGEEPGKIAHELPGVITRDGISTKYSASDSTAMWMIGCEHYFRVTRDLSFLIEIMPTLTLAYQQLVTHIDLRSGLFLEDPTAFQTSPGGLKTMYWKDSVLLNRMQSRTSDTSAPAASGTLPPPPTTKPGSPSYPVAFLLVQAQTLAAVRAVESLWNMTEIYAPSPPQSSSTSHWSSLRDSLRSLFSTTKLPPSKLIRILKKGFKRYFFVSSPDGPDAEGGSEEEVKKQERMDEEDVATSIQSTALEHTSVLPIPPRSRCPHFGVDTLGTLGTTPGYSDEQGGSVETEDLKTSDVLHALYYLTPSDLTPTQLERWFAPTTSRDPTTTSDPSSSSPWTASCYQSLESTIGYTTSSLSRESQPTGSSLFVNREEQQRKKWQAMTKSVVRKKYGSIDSASVEKEISYHHRSIWAFEQVLIHQGAKKFGLNHVANVAERWWKSVEKQMGENSVTIAGAAERPTPFAEYYLPLSLASTSFSTPPRLTLEADASLTSTADSSQSWRAQGAHTQLWSIAAYQYWQEYELRKREKGMSSTTKNSVVDLRAPAILDAKQQQQEDRCVSDKTRLLRGIAPERVWRYCPITSSSSGSKFLNSPSSIASSSSSITSSVFTCLDNSSILPLSSVNDDYCDCSDGSDELGTAACSGSLTVEMTSHSVSTEAEQKNLMRFSCVRNPQQLIHRSMVDDGVCDCCDGSDERDSGVQCRVKC